jgi:hypothetical protein
VAPRVSLEVDHRAVEWLDDVPEDFRTEDVNTPVEQDRKADVVVAEFFRVDDRLDYVRGA